MRLIFFLFLLPISCALTAQTLRVDDDYAAERLVREVFVSGQCESITNVERIGNNPAAIGFFDGGESSVGFDKGIIISTGKASSAPGPNTASDVGFRFDEDYTIDEDLGFVSTETTFDRAGIEFDFVPLSPVVTFRYVFASEEYCDFVGRAFNDLFGFFVSGPGINGPFNKRAINLATIPGTDDLVSINTVNFRDNKDFYLDNEFPSVRNSRNCGGTSSVGPRFSLIEYDGQTVILTATVELQVCETYHLRMVIADVQDGKWDSAVFLEAGSFNVGGSVSLENEAGDAEPIVVYEGCAPANVRVQRGADSDARFAQTIAYRIDTRSGATPGVDFTTGDGTITIPAGEDFALLPVTALADDRTEGPERVFLILDVPCACYSDSVEIVITEPGELVIEAREAFYCPGQDLRLDARPTGGAEPYAYRWSFGSVDARPSLSAPLPPSVSVTVTDACGQVATGDLDITAVPPPAVTAPAQDLRGCRDDELNLELFLVGQPPFTLSYTVDGGAAAEYQFLEDSLQRWPLTQGGDYRLVEIRDAACATALDTTFRVTIYEPSITSTVTPPSCVGVGDGFITVAHSPTVGPYTYEFAGLPTTDLTYGNLGAGTYGVRVTDALGCTSYRDIILQDPDSITTPVIDCEDLRNGPLRPTALGGVAPYTYSTDGRNYFDEAGFDLLQTGDTYTLYVRDAVGCEVVEPDFFWPATHQGMARLPNLIFQELGGSVWVRPEYLVPPEQIGDYLWLPRDVFDCTDCPETTVAVPKSQTISVVVEDIYGCRDSVVTEVIVDNQVPVYVPTAFSPNGDGTNDVLTVFANPAQIREVISFEVYTRWGGLVWQDNNYAPTDAGRGWDGLVGGRPASKGTYVWVARVLLTSDEVQTKRGTVVLMNGS
ncbi:choice-of-anchor L domain-containing protein [Neolewinella antarctica]|uniref:Gliding motility-associated-like protein n=1 Tax=Neolewinella antarctica TaxID=442734 RepID=A0ABX0XG90_9BACT|nr:choice-of-anchor L domain-containing protein [Neolewinella antarctica]NJC28246.1 gliding motility-associated-like protein [Neolewinella antarctica]